MARFKYTDNSQGLFLPVNLEAQLLPGTFEWTLNYLIARIDLSIFNQNYHNDEKGAAAYSPTVLLKLIMYCYSLGIISSRRMEAACKNNIIIKTLAENSEPDHTTIATFISTNSEAVKELFTHVLLQCNELKLITGEMFAIDGCKLSSNASKEWSGKISDLVKRRNKLENMINQILLQHQKLDKDESVKSKQTPFKKTMGDDRKRRERHVERLEKKLKKLDEFLQIAEHRIGLSGKEIKSNITDNESAFIKSPHGYIQGYNGIAIADSGNQVIVCAEAIGSGPESGCFPEMLDSLEENMTTISGDTAPLKNSLLEGDTGFFSEKNLQEAQSRKIQVLIPDHQFRRREAYFVDRELDVVKKKKYTIEDFNYDEGKNCYICPAGKELAYKGNVKSRDNKSKKYQAAKGNCLHCQLIDKCISRRTRKNPGRALYIAVKNDQESLSDKMKKTIDDPAYRELYSF